MHHHQYAVVNPSTKTAGRQEALALAAMGRRAVISPYGTGYATAALRGGPVMTPNWADASTRARLMPRDRDGRFVSLASAEVAIQAGVGSTISYRPAPLLYVSVIPSRRCRCCG